MNDDLSDLYQEVILDHNKSPRNFREIKNATHAEEGFNPLCGDQVKVFLKLDHDTISDISFLGHGCAISKASASMMTQSLKGKTIAEARTLSDKFRRAVTGKDDAKDLGKLAVLVGVRDYPTRVKCAVLAWHAALAALEGKTDPVSTE